MLSGELRNIMYYPKRNVSTKLVEKIKYLEDLERRGLIEKPIPQTAYKYPVEILPNGRSIGCKTR